MLGREHAVFGLTTSAAVSVAYFAPEFFVPTVACGFLGALLPDIDLPTSTIGKITYPIAWLINKFFGHRTITHDPILWIPIGIFLLWKFHYAWVAGLVIGYWGHLFLDSFTAGGIPILWILRKYKKGFHLLPYKWKIYASSLSAKVISILLSMVISALILFVGMVSKTANINKIFSTIIKCLDI